MLSPKDLALRQKGIGSSEIGVLLGLSPKSHGTPHDLWRRKKLGESQDGKPQFEFGHLMESGVIIPLYEKQTGYTVHEVPTKQHPKFPIVIDSADGIVFRNREPIACLEAKTVHFTKRAEWGRAGTDQIPSYYWAQCQWHMAAHGLKRCEVPALFAGDFDITLYDVRRDEDAFTKMYRKAEQWWETYIIGNKEPPIDHSPEASKWLSKKYSNPTAELALAPAGAYSLRETLQKAEKNHKALGEQIDRLKNQLKDMIGNNAGIRYGDGDTVKWTPYKQSRVNWKGVASDANASEEVIRRHTKTIESRRLSFKWGANS